MGAAPELVWLSLSTAWLEGGMHCLERRLVSSLLMRELPPYCSFASQGLADTLVLLLQQGEQLGGAFDRSVLADRLQSQGDGDGPVSVASTS